MEMLENSGRYESVGSCAFVVNAYYVVVVGSGAGGKNILKEVVLPLQQFDQSGVESGMKLKQRNYCS